MCVWERSEEPLGLMRLSANILRARFLACIRFIRFFLISILQSSASRAFYAFVTSFSVCLAAFSRASFSRVTVRSAAFLTLFFITSRAFPSCIIACCSFYLPPYVIIDVLPLPARLHVHTPEQLLQP
jgi:hypothetical protein